MAKFMKKKACKKSSHKVALRQLGQAPTARAVHGPSIGLGRSVDTVLKTVFFANVTPAGTGVWTGNLSPGSAFAPGGSVAPLIRPAMWAEWSRLYARYVVTAAKVKITIRPQSTLGTPAPVAWVACGYPATDPTPLATFQAAASQQYSKVVNAGGIEQFRVLKWGYKELDSQKIIGSRLPVIAETDGAAVTSDPTALQFMRIPLFVQLATTTSYPFTMIVEIDQKVTFDQKIQNA